MQKLIDALVAFERAKSEVTKVIEEGLPPGTEVAWASQGHIYNGVIERECYGHKVMVRNVRTGATHKIGVASLLYHGVKLYEHVDYVLDGTGVSG